MFCYSMLGFCFSSAVLLFCLVLSSASLRHAIVQTDGDTQGMAAILLEAAREDLGKAQVYLCGNESKDNKKFWSVTFVFICKHAHVLFSEVFC